MKEEVKDGELLWMKSSKKLLNIIIFIREKKLQKNEPQKFNPDPHQQAIHKWRARLFSTGMGYQINFINVTVKNLGVKMVSLESMFQIAHKSLTSFSDMFANYPPHPNPIPSLRTLFSIPQISVPSKKANLISPKKSPPKELKEKEWKSTITSFIQAWSWSGLRRLTTQDDDGKTLWGPQISSWPYYSKMQVAKMSKTVVEQ